MELIQCISVYSHANDLRHGGWNPLIQWTYKYSVFVCLEDDQGRRGIGECWCFDTSPEPLCTYLRTEIIPSLLGQSLEELDELGEQLRKRATLTARHGMLASAWSGIDIARWDLAAKQKQQPLWRLLNPAGGGYASLYASGGLYQSNQTSIELAEEMLRYTDQGFSLIKMKVGGLPIDDDIERVQRVLDTVPDTCHLIIDGVYSYQIDTAWKFFSALPINRISAFQSPIDASDIQGMTELSHAGVPVMAVETEYRQDLQERLIDEQAVHFLQLAPIACGGISRLNQLRQRLNDSKIQLSLEVSSTAIALMAACQYAAATPAVAHVEFHCLHRVFFEQLTLQYSDCSLERAHLPNSAGLGMDLPLELVTREYEIGR